MGGIAYFFYIDRQLITRIYLLNFGIGVICLASTLRLRGLRYGKAAERVLFWVLLAFSIHFFLRTTLTVGLVAPSATNFASSPFWLALQYSVAVLGVALALAIVQVTVSDTLDELPTGTCPGSAHRTAEQTGFRRIRDRATAGSACMANQFDGRRYRPFQEGERHARPSRG